MRFGLFVLSGVTALLLCYGCGLSGVSLMCRLRFIGLRLVISIRRGLVRLLV